MKFNCIMCHKEINEPIGGLMIDVPDNKRRIYFCKDCLKKMGSEQENCIRSIQIGGSLPKSIVDNMPPEIQEKIASVIGKRVKEMNYYMSMLGRFFTYAENTLDSECQIDADKLMEVAMVWLDKTVNSAESTSELIKYNDISIFLLSAIKHFVESDLINEDKKFFFSDAENPITEYYRTEAQNALNKKYKKKQIVIPFAKEDKEENGEKCKEEPSFEGEPSEKSDDAVEETVTIMTPQEIKRQLDKSVVGQEHAKKVLSVGIYNHYKRIYNKKFDIKKSNIMFIGSTGVGKTELARTAAGILNVPFVMADATSLTQAGYVGSDVDDILVSLIHMCDGDVREAEKGIIYIDEIDKIARTRTSSKDVGGEGVQQSLLKLIEGAEITVDLDGKSNPIGRKATIDTSNILFICGGSFESITMKEKTHKVALGFNSVEEDEEPENMKIEPEDLVKFGMLPEFIGRFPLIVQLNDLSREDLKRILVEPENSIVKQYQDLFSIDDVTLDFTNNALELIADKAFNNKTGARGLKSIIEDSIMDLMFELPDEDDINLIKVGVSRGELNFKKGKVS